MPLLDGKVVDRISLPIVETTTRTQGWEIRYTGEIFLDYDKYLERLQFYRKPIWSCRESGRSQITYEQALLSERAEYHNKTGIGFSDILTCEMLTFLCQSSLPVSQAVDALYYRFLYDFFIGEHIDVKYPGTSGSMYECFVVAVGQLPAVETTEADENNPTRIAIERLGNHASGLIAFESRQKRVYTVRLFDVDGRPLADSDINVEAADLSRSRNVFTKVALRMFLDNHLHRAPRPGSPWVVAPQYRDRYRIPYMYGGDARLLRGSTTHHPSGKRKAGMSMAQLLQYGQNGGQQETNKAHHHSSTILVDPYADERQLLVKSNRKGLVDDLEQLQIRHVKYEQSLLWSLRRAHENGGVDNKETTKIATTITKYFPSTSNNGKPPSEPQEDEVSSEEVATELGDRWPVPLTEWQVPMGLVSRMLSVYTFLSCFSNPLNLTPNYSLDYFETALTHQLPSADTPSVMVGDDSPEPKGKVYRPSGVYRNTVIALLNSIIEDRARTSKEPTNVSARIDMMVKAQDEVMSDPEKESPQQAQEQEQAAKMEVDSKPEVEKEQPAPEVKKEEEEEDKELVVLNAKTSSRRKPYLRSNGRPDARTMPTRASRLRQTSLLESSSDGGSAFSEEEEEDSDAVKSPQRPGRKRKMRTRLNGSSRSNKRQSTSSSHVSSSEAEEEEEQEEDVEIEGSQQSESGTLADSMATLSVMRPHEMLRHLSRTWSQSLVGNVKGDEWSWSLVGWMIEAQYDYAELKPMVEHLWNNPALTLAALETSFWGPLDIEQRLAILELLVIECNNNECIRNYLDTCLDTTADLRRERIEVRREIKKAQEAALELNKEAEPGDKDGEGLDSRDESRQTKEQEHERQNQLRKLGERERTYTRRQDHIDRELRRNNINRLVPIGTDRFFNKYYFVDGIGGTTDASTTGSGRLLVKPAAREEQQEALQTQPRYVSNTWALEMPEPWTGGLACAEPDRGLMRLAQWTSRQTGREDEIRELARDGELWGYYATTGQLEMLRKWLDPKGRRERALLVELELLYAQMGMSIRRRNKELEQSYVAQGKARERLCAQISAHLQSAQQREEDMEEAEDTTLRRLQGELKDHDSARLPGALRPPQTEVDQLYGVAKETTSKANSSRASSVEPMSSSSEQKPRRGRKPKTGLQRGRRMKTFMDGFISFGK